MILGVVEVHVHGAGKYKAPDLSYSYKLWLAHGVTTVRGVSLSSAALSSSEKNRSAKNEIVAPRIFNYQTLGSGWANGPVRSPGKGAWVHGPRPASTGSGSSTAATRRRRSTPRRSTGAQTRWARSLSVPENLSRCSTRGPATRLTTPSLLRR